MHRYERQKPYIYMHTLSSMEHGVCHSCMRPCMHDSVGNLVVTECHGRLAVASTDVCAWLPMAVEYTQRRRPVVCSRRDVQYRSRLGKTHDDDGDPLYPAGDTHDTDADLARPTTPTSTRRDSHDDGGKEVWPRHNASTPGVQFVAPSSMLSSLWIRTFFAGYLILLLRAQCKDSWRESRVGSAAARLAHIYHTINQFWDGSLISQWSC